MLFAAVVFCFVLLPLCAFYYYFSGLSASGSQRHGRRRERGHRILSNQEEFPDEELDEDDDTSCIDAESACSLGPAAGKRRRKLWKGKLPDQASAPAMSCRMSSHPEAAHSAEPDAKAAADASKDASVPSTHQSANAPTRPSEQPSAHPPHPPRLPAPPHLTSPQLEPSSPLLSGLQSPRGTLPVNGIATAQPQQPRPPTPGLSPRAHTHLEVILGCIGSEDVVIRMERQAITSLPVLRSLAATAVTQLTSPSAPVDPARVHIRCLQESLPHATQLSRLQLMPVTDVRQALEATAVHVTLLQRSLYFDS